jgi:glycerol-3-phosphate acyltransferase PlsY
MDLLIAIPAFIAYLLGFPIGKLFAHAKGKRTELENTGSGSSGATNVSRVMGKKIGRIVLLLDCLKAACVVSFIYSISANYLDMPPDSIDRVWLKLIICMSCILGNIFPLLFGFKGGKAVATSLGIVFTLNLFAAIIGFGIFLVVYRARQTVSISSLFGTFASAVIGWGYYVVSVDYSILPAAFLSLIFLVVVLTHRKNISRLLQGNETQAQL